MLTEAHRTRGAGNQGADAEPSRMLGALQLAMSSRRRNSRGMAAGQALGSDQQRRMRLRQINSGHAPRRMSWPGPELTRTALRRRIIPGRCHFPCLCTSQSSTSARRILQVANQVDSQSTTSLDYLLETLGEEGIDLVQVRQRVKTHSEPQAQPQAWSARRLAGSSCIAIVVDQATANSRVHRLLTFDTRGLFFDSMGIFAHGAMSMIRVHSRCRDKSSTCLLSTRPSSTR